jgi:hypothetical protein
VKVDVTVVLEGVVERQEHAVEIWADAKAKMYGGITILPPSSSSRGEVSRFAGAVGAP